MTVLQELLEIAPDLKSEDLYKWVNPIFSLYEEKINELIKNIYNTNFSDSSFKLAKQAFEQIAKDHIEYILYCFFIDKKHWQNSNSNLEKYLEISLKRLAKNHLDNIKAVTRTNKYICPYCKTKNNTTFLIKENKMLRCTVCTSQFESVKNEPFNSELEALRVFSLHSKKGFKCLGCKNFIPQSCIKGSIYACPYDFCLDFNEVSATTKMTHPLKRMIRNFTLLDSKIETTKNSENINPESYLLVQENSLDKINTINSIIAEQRDFLSRNKTRTYFQRKLMLDAFEAMTKSNPADMINYLCEGKWGSNTEPLQSKIFQHYVSLIEDNLPFSIKKYNKEIEILTLTAPELSLFTGISTYKAQVLDKGIIPNLTEEHYLSKNKDYGPSFIGKLISVQDCKGNTLMSNVLSYSFSRIETSLEPKTQVTVTHFRMPSHYQMNGLVYLQKTRRKLVDSIYFKLHNKKRIPSRKK